MVHLFHLFFSGRYGKLNNTLKFTYCGEIIMDIRTYKKRFLSLSRRQRLLVLVVVNITVICLVLFFALLKVERRTSDQYQNQYYGQFEANLDAFLNIRDSTDNFCRPEYPRNTRTTFAFSTSAQASFPAAVSVVPSSSTMVWGSP